MGEGLLNPCILTDCEAGAVRKRKLLIVVALEDPTRLIKVGLIDPYEGYAAPTNESSDAIQDLQRCGMRNVIA